MPRDPSATDPDGVDPAVLDDSVGEPLDDGADPFGDGGEEILGSAGITDTRRVPDPAAYDEELMDAKLVETGVGEPVPGVHEDEVERAGLDAVADTTGSVTPRPGGGDMVAAYGGTPTGDPDDPRNEDASDVPEDYDMTKHPRTADVKSEQDKAEGGER